jgi:NAD(P)H-hydrate repair Nnr-like enzyme with NAD(P)H-hydrate dehydratase domain
MKRSSIEYTSSGKIEDEEVELVDDMVHVLTINLEENSIHCLVIGPGMGTDHTVLNIVPRITHEARKLGIYLVLEAAAIRLLSLPSYRYILQGYEKVVVVANATECKRLMVDGVYRKDDEDIGHNHDKYEYAYMNDDECSGDPLDAVTIVQTGYIDAISMEMW